EGRCSLKSWVFKSFLKVERDAPALVVLGSSFHQRGTTNENSLDCRACTDGSAKRRSLEPSRANDPVELMPHLQQNIHSCRCQNIPDLHTCEVLNSLQKKNKQTNKNKKLG